MLAVMSGQGGIAVLVSGVQVALAFISALSQGGTTPEKDGPQAIVSGLGLWALAAAGAVGCLAAHKAIRVDAIPRESAPAMKVFRKNWVLELAVAWVFVVTLVGRQMATLTSGCIPSDHHDYHFDPASCASAPQVECLHPTTLLHLQQWVAY